MDIEKIFDEVCEVLEAHGVFQTGLMENGEEEGVFKFRFLLVAPEEEDKPTRKRTRWVPAVVVQTEVGLNPGKLMRRRKDKWKEGVEFKKKDKRSFLYNLEAIRNYEDAQA